MQPSTPKMMNEIKKEAIKEFKENFYQLPGIKERDFINKYIAKAYRAGFDAAMKSVPNPNYSQAEIDKTSLTQKKKDAEIVNKMCQEAERRDTTISAWLWLDTARKAILNQLELLDSIR